MARIRTIKPGFFKSEDVSALPLRARLTWIGLWTHCDDAGRTKDSTRLIKGDVWPLDDVSLRDIEEDLKVLAANGRIVRYEVDGQRYLEIANWSEHQVINRPTKSKLPAPPNGLAPAGKVPRSGVPEPRETTGSYPQVRAHGPLTEPSRGEGKGKEGKGRDARAREEPPLQCPEHVDNPNPPSCGKCAGARRSHDRWEADRNTRLRYAPKCPRHVGELATNCRLCRAEQLATGDT